MYSTCPSVVPPIILDAGYRARWTPDETIELYASLMGGRVERTYVLPQDQEEAWRQVQRLLDYFSVPVETDDLFFAVWHVSPRNWNTLPRDKQALARKDATVAKSEAIYLQNMLRDVRDALRTTA